MSRRARTRGTGGRCGQVLRKAGEPPTTCDLDRPCPIHADPGELAYERAIERQARAAARQPSYDGEGRDI